jgi:hypothetical protein
VLQSSVHYRSQLTCYSRHSDIVCNHSAGICIVCQCSCWRLCHIQGCREQVHDSCVSTAAGEHRRPCLTGRRGVCFDIGIYTGLKPSISINRTCEENVPSAKRNQARVIHIHHKQPSIRQWWYQIALEHLSKFSKLPTAGKESSKPKCLGNSSATKMLLQLISSQISRLMLY